MRIGEKRKLIKRIKRMVLLPALIALVLIVIGEIGARKAGKSESGTAGESLTAVTEQTQNAEGQDSDGKDPGAGAGEDGAEEEAGAGEAAGTGEAGTGEAAGPGSGDAGENGTESPAEILTEPMQKIAFRAADSGGESPGIQRSVPVQIDSSILGGEAGTTCWAVFLPAEMEEHTAILLSGYKSVTMAELEEGEYLSDVRLGPASGDSEKEKTDTIGSEGTSGEEEKAHTYSSGDELYGLDNGSAFSVTLEAEDGSEYSDILYVFSCNDTATMYLDTESGSMETVDGDLTKNTSENAKFVIFMPDGSADCEGECAVSGRGNSTWGMKKRPYNVDFTEKKSVLGMTACKKLCLLANTFDQTNLLDRISSQIALDLGMRDTPQGEFVNLYLNGQYNGMYFLSQRPRTGGCVNIDKMDKRIREANGIDSSGDTNLPEKKALHEEGERLKKWAYDWPKEPLDNTGGYLLQQYSRYEGDDCWFSTMHRRYRIMSPSYPTVGQVNYISDYICSRRSAPFTARTAGTRNPESITRSIWIWNPGRTCSFWRNFLSNGTRSDGASM